MIHHGGNMMNVSDFDGLECLTIRIVQNHGGHSPYLKGLSKCCNLRTLKIVDLLMCDADVEELSMCKHLVKLKFSGNLTRYNTFRCNGLRMLKIKNYQDEDLEIMMNCLNLQCVEIVGWNILTNVEMLSDLKMLRRVKLRRCCKLRDVEVLRRCRRLKYVRILECPNIMYLKN